MRRTLLFLVLLLGPAGTASASTLHISPSGSDSAQCTQAAPCQSFARAYGVAAAGDVVQVNAGSYGPQTLPSGSKSLSFRGVAGNKVRQLKSSASNITFDGLDLDAARTKTTGAVFEHGGASNVTLKNSRVGNVTDEKGAMLGGSSSTAKTNLVIDNVDFHDVYVQASGTHNECIMAHAPGITIRNSTFTNCHTMDISLGRGDWWGQPPYGNVTLENNVFGHSTNGSGWHYYGLAWFVGKVENARVVNNTFENQVRMESIHIGGGPYSGVWANNIGGGWQCLSGVTYRNNVGKKCDASDIATSPASSCGPPACPSLQTMPVGWVDPANWNFHLRSDSIAIDKASATYAPATDKDARTRNGAPDAGAYEYAGGSGPVPAPSPTPTPTPSPTPSPTPAPTPAPTQDTTPPSVPQGYTTTGTTQTSISQQWNAATDNVGVTGYRVYLDGVRQATVTQTSHTFTGLKCGTRYETSITAVDAAGNESYRPQAVAFVTTPACAASDTQPPSVPKGYSTTGKTRTTISQKWNAATDNVGVTGYRGYLNGTRVATVSATSHQFTGLVCGTRYETSVTAIDAAGNESYRPQAVAFVTTSACPTSAKRAAGA